MFRRSLLLFAIIYSLTLLPACSSPTVTYFPVRQDSGPSPLALNSGKLVLKDGCLRLDWPGSSRLLIWPHGYSYRVSGRDVEVLDASGVVVATTGRFIQLGGGEVPSVKSLTGTEPPAGCPGPYWLVGEVVGNLYPWDFPALRELVMLLIGLAAVVSAVVWLMVHRRRIKRTSREAP